MGYRSLVMKLSDLLLRNWKLWSTGGQSNEVLALELGKEDIRDLLTWLDKGCNEAELVLPVISIKSVVDIATWSLYGTHSLFYEPSEFRQKKLN
jgi:hypothetical protein